MCLTENRSRSLYSVHLYTPPPRVMAELLPELLTEHLAPASWPGDPGLRVAGHLGKLLPEHKDHTANHFLSQLGRAIFEDKLNQSPVETKSHFLFSSLLGAPPCWRGPGRKPLKMRFIVQLFGNHREVFFPSSHLLKALFLECSASATCQSSTLGTA